MAIRDFMGIDVSAFKRFYKDSKKTNTNMKNRCYWAEKENNTYFCDGYMIICFKDTTLFQVARVFNLSFDDMPNEDKPAQDLASRMFPVSFLKFTPVKSSIPQNTRPQKVLPMKRFSWIGARVFPAC